MGGVGSGSNRAARIAVRGRYAALDLVIGVRATVFHRTELLLPVVAAPRAMPGSERSSQIFHNGMIWFGLNTVVCFSKVS